MACYHCDRPVFSLDDGLEFLQRLDCQSVIFSQGSNKTITPVRSKPDGISGEQVFVIYEVCQVSPCMARYKNTFDFNIVNGKNLAIF